MLFLQSWLQGMEAVACMFWSGQLGLKMKKKKREKGGEKKPQTKIQFGFAVTGEFLCWALAEGQIWQGGLQIFYVVLLTPLPKRTFFLPPSPRKKTACSHRRLPATQTRLVPRGRRSPRPYLRADAAVFCA